MTYRPIGIAPLRNYGWELSNHLCAPSRQVKRPRKKKKGTRDISYGERARSYTAGGGNQREPILPVVQGEIAAGMLYPRSELRDTSTIATNHL